MHILLYVLIAYVLLQFGYFCGATVEKDRQRKRQDNR